MNASWLNVRLSTRIEPFNCSFVRRLIIGTVTFFFGQTSGTNNTSPYLG